MNAQAGVRPRVVGLPSKRASSAALLLGGPPLRQSQAGRFNASTPPGQSHTLGEQT
jgi:hypothetical protein